MNTAPQSSLDRLQRKHNLNHVFACQPVNYQHITLIDDVTTTGSTIKTLANLFQQQGVSKIDAWILCKS
jgi:predicted amidophosphoribosyltransferase